MCVIVVKPIGNKLPSLDTLEKCSKANKDGIGYMLTYNHKVIIRKGFMDFKSFLKDLVALKKEFEIKDFKSIPMVFHFRITTQGGVKKELCHPYAVCDNYDTMRLLNTTCSIGMAHNGIISLTSDYGHYDYSSKTYVSHKDTNYNDTMTFIKDYASLIINNDVYFPRNKAKVKLLENLVGSGNKLAFLNSKGYIKLIGKFDVVDGIYFSNLHWKNERKETKFYSSFNDNKIVKKVKFKTTKDLRDEYEKRTSISFGNDYDLYD